MYYFYFVICHLKSVICDMLCVNTDNNNNSMAGEAHSSIQSMTLERRGLCCDLIGWWAYDDREELFPACIYTSSDTPVLCWSGALHPWAILLYLFLIGVSIPFFPFLIQYQASSNVDLTVLDQNKWTWSLWACVDFPDVELYVLYSCGWSLHMPVAEEKSDQFWSSKSSPATDI